MIRVSLVGFGRTGKVVAEGICLQEDVELVSVFKKQKDEFVGRDIGEYFKKKVISQRPRKMVSISSFARQTFVMIRGTSSMALATGSGSSGLRM